MSRIGLDAVHNLSEFSGLACTVLGTRRLVENAYHAMGRATDLHCGRRLETSNYASSEYVQEPGMTFSSKLCEALLFGPRT